MNFIETLKPISKAVAGGLAGALVAFLMKHNIVIADGMADAIEIVIGGAITALIVYLAPKNNAAGK